jgi:hypothetical protein
VIAIKLAQAGWAVHVTRIDHVGVQMHHVTFHRPSSPTFVCITDDPIAGMCALVAAFTEASNDSCCAGARSG